VRNNGIRPPQCRPFWWSAVCARRAEDQFRGAQRFAGMTDSPALAFCFKHQRLRCSDVSYASVYPLTMVLCILSMQILELLLCG
jgi:hypothetical protein